MSYRFRGGAPEHPLVAALARMAHCQERSEAAWRELLAELHGMRGDLAELTKRLDAMPKGSA